ncbi:MAG: hypothetical protein QY304_00135 [Candidatus Paceibacterota bacterium]|nr:MAG: hypothetical protein QY304_00135 [Candidatus Paceibacterota bacterium]
MIKVIPAIIPKSFHDLEEKMSQVVGLVPLVQIDVMDGKLTPEASWPYLNSENTDFVAIKKEEKEFPFWEELDFEVDLMVRQPENVWFDWIIAGAKRIIFHVESTEDLGSLVKNFKEKLPASDSALHIELGLALDIDTPNEKVYPFVPELDFVQFMGIAKIGFQGQPFDERVLEKIKSFKQKFPEAIVSVDGGVSLETAPRLIEAGATRLASGSAIFESGNISGTIENLKNLG